MKRLASLLVCASLLLFITIAAIAQDDDKDHHHHEDLTETQLGTVHFPVSCDAKVQHAFERGVAMLHSFWYEEAEKQFTQIAKDDPHCAMAHWGVAMSIWHQLWNEPDAKVIARGFAEAEKAAVMNLGQQTPVVGSLPFPKEALVHDSAYITAIFHFYGDSKTLDHTARAKAYSDWMRKAYESYPDDHEAATFYALSLLASEPPHDATFASRKQAAAILEKLFSTEPDHPGVAHYLIHSYDKPQLAELGIPAARRYAQIAPAAPHALHMPSHIFARVGLWPDDIKSNLASVAATRKEAAMGMGGEGHQFHALDFLFYAYLQSGREDQARALMDEVSKMPHVHDMYGVGFDPHLATEAFFASLYPLEMHDWTAAAALPPTSVEGTAENSFRYWSKAIGSAHLHQADDVRKDVAAIEAIHQKFVDDKSKMLAEAAEQDLNQAKAWLAFAEGKTDDAIALLRPIAEKEEAEGDEPQGIPTREMIADMLLEAKRPQQALTEYQTDLKFSPNRFDGLAGAAQASEQSAKQSDASSYYAQLLKSCDGGSSTRPELSRAKELLAKK